MIPTIFSPFLWYFLVRINTYLWWVWGYSHFRSLSPWSILIFIYYPNTSFTLVTKWLVSISTIILRILYPLSFCFLVSLNMYLRFLRIFPLCHHCIWSVLTSISDPKDPLTYFSSCPFPSMILRCFPFVSIALGHYLSLPILSIFYVCSPFP